MRTRGVTFNPFDVVVVPFPFTDRRAVRRRPALVVSSLEFNRAHDHSILAMITTAGSDWPSDAPVHAGRAAGLNVPCKIRFKLFTLDNDLVVRKLGSLAQRDVETVVRALSRFLTTV